MHDYRCWTTWIAASVAAALFSTVSVEAAVVVKAPLTATASAPNAKGHAGLVLRTTTKGQFTVSGRGLAAHRSYDVVVGGIKVGTFTTNARGVGKAKFRTAAGNGAANAHGRKRLLGFDPRGDKVVVRDGTTSDDDLVGEMPGRDDSTSGAFACCEPNDDSGEGEGKCVTKPASDCAASGGTATQVTSCVPDPCAQTPPSGAVCCLPGSARGVFLDGDDEGDSEVECEDVASVEACVAQGGAVVTATSCDPNPCRPAPPTSVCCLPGSAEGAFVGDDDGWGEHHTEAECVLHESADACTAAGGTVVTASSCHPDPCAVTSPPPVLACCFPGSADGGFVRDDVWGGPSSAECQMLPPPACVGQGGTVSGPSCATHPCSGRRGKDRGDDDSQGDDSQGDG